MYICMDGWGGAGGIRCRSIFHRFAAANISTYDLTSFLKFQHLNSKNQWTEANLAISHLLHLSTKAYINFVRIDWFYIVFAYICAAKSFTVRDTGLVGFAGKPFFSPHLHLNRSPLPMAISCIPFAPFSPNSIFVQVNKSFPFIVAKCLIPSFFWCLLNYNKNYGPYVKQLNGIGRLWKNDYSSFVMWIIFKTRQMLPRPSPSVVTI